MAENNEVAPTEAPAEKPAAPADTAGSMNAAVSGRQSSAVRKEPKTFYERFCPKLAIYLFKFVCINNSRLAILYYFLMVWMILCMIGYFMVNDEYMVDISPWVRTFVYPQVPSDTGAYSMDAMADADANSLACTNPSNYKYANNIYHYEPTGCVQRCGRGPRPPYEMCMHPNEMLQDEGDMMFVPTFVNQMSVFPATADAGATTCPAGYNLQGSYCIKENTVFVPGAGGVKLQFTHQYTSKPIQGAWMFASENLRGQSRSKDGHGHDDKGMTTYFIGTDGNTVRKFNPGEVIEVSVDELLQNAEYDNVGPGGPLNLDQEVSRVTMGINKSTLDGSEDVLLRMMGATVTVDLYVTDKGTCRHELTDEMLEFAAEGSIACMFVFAERMWTSSGSSQVIYSDRLQGTLTRRSHGIRVKFRRRGAFTTFDMTELMKIFTVCIVWFQIPLQLTYYFTIFCLGHLSSVYGRVIHQDLHLADACKGLASRLVSHSAAYMDLQDQATGIGKGRLLERFKVVLSQNKNLDDVEIAKFVDFVFEGMQSLGMAAETDQSSDTVNIQEYCTACSTNEPLDFDSLVKLFDKDRKIGLLEGCFLDKSIRKVIQSGRDQDSSATIEAMKFQEDAQANMVETLYTLNDLKGKSQELSDRLSKGLKAASASMSLEHELSAKAKIIAESRKSAGKNVIDPVSDFKVTEDPKPDQRESNCSIADEDEVGRAPAQS